jgi:hypothetical protein
MAAQPPRLFVFSGELLCRIYADKSTKFMLIKAPRSTQKRTSADGLTGDVSVPKQSEFAACRNAASVLS